MDHSNGESTVFAPTSCSQRSIRLLRITPKQKNALIGHRFSREQHGGTIGIIVGKALDLAIKTPGPVGCPASPPSIQLVSINYTASESRRLGRPACFLRSTAF